MTLAQRNRLVEAHIGLVKNIAVALAKRLPAWIDLDDLMQEGYLALIQAAKRYRNGPVIFGKFAQLRVRGAMLDSIRRRHWTYGTHVELPEADEDEPRCDATVEAELVEAQAAAGVRAALRELPRSQRRVLRLRYERDRTLAAAAGRMGVSAYRASKLHRDGLERLRTCDAKRHCAHCGAELRRRVWASGRPEELGQFERRKFCDAACYRRSLVKHGRFRRRAGGGHGVHRPAALA